MRILLYRLYDRKSEAPDWWHNFLISTSPHLDTNALLKQYGATFVLNGDERWLVFDREEQYTWFILRFSS